MCVCVYVCVSHTIGMRAKDAQLWHVKTGNGKVAKRKWLATKCKFSIQKGNYKNIWQKYFFNCGKQNLHVNPLERTPLAHAPSRSWSRSWSWSWSRTSLVGAASGIKFFWPFFSCCCKHTQQARSSSMYGESKSGRAGARGKGRCEECGWLATAK